MELALSPIFNLSMASKELFHSNLLYWIGITYRAQFMAIMERLDVETDEWPNNWTIHREKDHFDLLITSEDEKSYFLILENKVKSIPHTDQLDYYQKKNHQPNTALLLLSLATNLPNQDEINEKGWIIKNYQDYAYAIYSVLPSITNDYHRLLLEDYCMCILSLHEKQLSWNYEEAISYVKQFVKERSEEKSLRIEDMRKKVLYSKLAADLQKTIDAKIYTNKQILSNNDAIGNVYVNYGMTRSMGLVDVKVRIKGNFMFVIQLQGEAYKHCVETLDKEGLGYVKDIGLMLKNDNANLQTTNTTMDIVEQFFSFTNAPVNNNIYPFKDNTVTFPKSHKKGNRKNTAYNQYGESFIYQYIKLPEGITVKEVIEAIVEDVNKILKIIRPKTNL